MIHFDDLTEKEIEVRALLTRKKSDFERRDTPFSRWCQQLRDAWEQTPAGKLAIAQSGAKRDKARRRG
jgi:hypothetical protein